jgi:DNA-binding NarL/FixJ family response regulator
MKEIDTIEVMILEDHYFSNKILSKYIHNVLEASLPEGQNFKISSFKSGTECVMQMPEKLDLAILDYYLTNDDSDASVDMNGLEILRFIQRKSPECKVIMVSALRNVDIVHQIKEENIFAYIDKHEGGHEEIGKLVKQALSI